MNERIEAAVHAGHRSRMRAKLMTHGADIFDTYELLEMLLYYVIPYRDTNPIAKRLLAEFGDLHGVLHADKQQLVSVNGIGERAAGLIKDVGEAVTLLENEMNHEDVVFDDFHSVGGFFVDYFAGRTNSSTVALYLDNGMRPLHFETVCECDLSRSSDHSSDIVQQAVRLRASVVITAHNHPNGPFAASEEDKEASRTVTAALMPLDIVHIEHYLVSGNYYTGIEKRHLSRMSSMSVAMLFADSRDADEHVSASYAAIHFPGSRYDERSREYLLKLLRWGGIPSDMAADELLSRRGSLQNLFDSHTGELSAAVGDSCALFLKLVAYVSSRSLTDLFKFGKKHTASEISDFFKASFLGLSEECITLMCFDKNENAICSFAVSSGTVNSSEVSMRRLLEYAVDCNAHSIILAHNHPRGNANPSENDYSFTSYAAKVFEATGINFKYHFVVAGQNVSVIDAGAKTVATDVVLNSK